MIGGMALKERRSPYGVLSVEKALDVLEAMQDADERTLQDVAQRSGLPKSSCFRFLSTLEARGYVERGTADKRYRLTLKLVEISQRLISQNPVRRRAMPQMYLLSEKFGETVNLAVLSGGDVLYIETVESHRPFRVTESPGGRSPVYLTALGKAMAAHLSQGDLGRLLERQSFHGQTPHTITSRDQFLECLEQVRRTGYALDNEESELGVRCVAAPILGPGGYPVAAVSISSPAARLELTEFETVATAVAVACRTISEQIGYRA
jgi:DNA-binding IclR family transcriptional regulator